MHKKKNITLMFLILQILCSSSWAYDYEIRNIEGSLLEFVPETYLASEATDGARMIDENFTPSVFVSSNGFRVNYSVPVGFDGLAPPNKGEICAVDSSRPGLDKRTYFADAGIELSDSVCDTFETKDLEAYAGFVTVSSFDLRSDFITRILDRNGTELKRMIGRVPLVIEGREAVDGNGTRFVFNFRNNTSKAIKLLKVTPLEGDESYIRVISGGDAEVLLRPDPTVVHNATVELIGRKSSSDSTGSFEVKVEVKYEIEGKSLTGMVILACDNHRAVMAEIERLRVMIRDCIVPSGDPGMVPGRVNPSNPFSPVRLVPDIHTLVVAPFSPVRPVPDIRTLVAPFSSVRQVPVRRELSKSSAELLFGSPMRPRRGGAKDK